MSDTPTREDLLQEIHRLKEENRLLKAERDVVPATSPADLLFRTMADADPRAVIIRDADLNPVYANPAFLEITGFSLNDFFDTAYRRLVPEKVQKVALEEVVPILKTGKTWEGMLQTRNKNGDDILLKSIAAPIMDESGKLAYLFIRMHSPAEDSALNTALSLSGELTRAVFSGSPLGIGVTGNNGRFLAANRALCDMFGYTEKELAGLGIADLTHPEDWEREKEIRQSLPSLPDRHYTLEKRVFTKNGETIWVKLTASVMKDSDGHIRYAVGMCEDITIAKIMRETLLDSEKRFWEILNKAQNILYRFNVKRNRYDYISSYAAQVSLYSINELMNMGYEQVAREIHPDDLHLFEEAIEKAVAERNGKKTMDTVLQYRRKGPDGEYLWFNDFPTMIFDEKGRVEAYVGVAYNVTEEKLAEDRLKQAGKELEDRVRDRTEELRESEARLRTLIDNLPFDFWAMDMDGRYTMQNAHSRNGWGDVVGLTINDLGLDEETAGIWKQEGDRVRRGETLRSEYSVPGDNGPRYFESVIAPISPGGKQVGILGVTMDITDRKQAERELAESETTFRNLAENSIQGITLSKGIRPKVMFVNSALCRITGYSKEEFLNMTPRKIAELIHPDDRDFFINSYADRIQGKPAPERYEFKAIRKDGAVRRLEIFSTMTEYEGEPAIQAAYVDITDRKTAQERIEALTGEVLKAQEAERSALARDLHDNVAQDLSTLKIGCSTLMEDLAGTPMFDRDRFMALSRTLERTISAVRGMAYELLPPGIDILKPSKLLEQVCDEFSKSTGIKTNFSAAGMEGIDLDTDRTLNVYRIIQEALNNIKSHSHALRAKIRVVASHPEILLRIEDDGQGFDIDHRTIEALEEKRMGLWSMRERARLMGGQFDIKSRLGKGVRILVTIPYKATS